MEKTVNKTEHEVEYFKGRQGLKTIFEDISNFYSLKTENLTCFKKILYFLVTIPPGQINIHNLAKNIKLDDKTILNYIRILQETGLVNIVFVDIKKTK